MGQLCFATAHGTDPVPLLTATTCSDTGPANATEQGSGSAAPVRARTKPGIKPGQVPAFKQGKQYVRGRSNNTQAPAQVVLRQPPVPNGGSASTALALRRPMPLNFPITACTAVVAISFVY